MLHHKTFVLGPDHEWVVFVHGAGGSSSIWYRQLREFRKHFNLLLIDLRGHGASPPRLEARDLEPYTFREVSAEILEVMDHLEIRSAHFVGISLGTILIRTLGEVAPERIRSMVLGGAITRLDLRSRFLVQVGTAVRRFVPFMWLYRLFAWIIMPKRRHRESRLLFVNEARKVARKEFLRWWRLTQEVNPLLRFFEEKELPVPTLYLMGDEDHMFLPPVRRIAARHRYSLLRVLEDSGHVCNVDQADLFNRHAIDFMHGRLAPGAGSA
ncbi:MAG TPA: alpha/beta fold hydrolase [Longimicrobiaceae bacterium]|nr:alpha/beta fold hydrolase [Longimicrobiaceae bacterium]